MRARRLVPRPQLRRNHAATASSETFTERKGGRGLTATRLLNRRGPQIIRKRQRDEMEPRGLVPSTLFYCLCLLFIRKPIR